MAPATRVATVDAPSGDRLVSISARICGFVSMQGAGERDAQLLLVNGTEEIVLRFDDGLPPPEPSMLANAVRSPRTESWTGVTVKRGVPVDTLQMYMATVLPGFCTMAVDPDLDTGLVSPYNKRFSMASVDGPNFAYITPVSPPMRRPSNTESMPLARMAPPSPR